MIKNKLSVLMAERLISVTDISKETGISRSTLTSIYYRKAKGITFDVLNKLCEYFDCEVSDILEHKKSTCS